MNDIILFQLKKISRRFANKTRRKKRKNQHYESVLQSCVLGAGKRRLLVNCPRLKGTKKWFQKYSDTCARSLKVIHLSLDKDTTKECPEYKDTDLVPPLEHCIRTR